MKNIELFKRLLENAIEAYCPEESGCFAVTVQLDDNAYECEVEVSDYYFKRHKGGYNEEPYCEESYDWDLRDAYCFEGDDTWEYNKNVDGVICGRVS